MMSRRGLIAASPGMLAGLGGLTPRRHDQTYDPPGNNLAPGQSGVFRGRQVVVGGTGPGTGVFVYNGSPGPGNPPVDWAVPPGVTADPFGNALPVNGGWSTKNNALGTVSNLIGGALLLYGQSPATYTQPGEVIVGNGSPHTLSLLSPQLAGDNQSVVNVVGAAHPYVAVPQGQFVVGSSVPAANMSAEFQATSGGIAGAGYANAASTPASVAGYAQTLAQAGNLKVQASDGNLYQTQTLRVRTYPGQLISTNSFNNVTGASVPVAAAHYTFRVRILYTTAAAAGAPQFQFTSPALTGNLSLMGEWAPSGGGATNIVARNTTSSLALGAGATLNGAGGGGNCTLEGDCTFSASGTLQLQALTTIAGDNYTVGAVYIDLYTMA